MLIKWQGQLADAKRIRANGGQVDFYQSFANIEWNHLIIIWSLLSSERLLPQCSSIMFGYIISTKISRFRKENKKRSITAEG